VDLTPYYANQQSTLLCIVEFHKHLKALCEQYDQDYEPFKKDCDEYFFLKHRNEARGVGGLFFDHLCTETHRKSKEELFKFVVALGMLFPELYEPFMRDGRHKEVHDTQREFHLFRRGRYVEFNLLYDRGTKFGLQSEGRVESILMSLPPLVRWHYNYSPLSGSPEALLLQVLQPRDWVNTDVASTFSSHA